MNIGQCLVRAVIHRVNSHLCPIDVNIRQNEDPAIRNGDWEWLSALVSLLGPLPPGSGAQAS